MLARDAFISFSAGEDRRERIVQVTSKGRQAYERTYPLWQQAQTTTTATLGKEHLSTFRSLLSELEVLPH